MVFLFLFVVSHAIAYELPMRAGFVASPTAETSNCRGTEFPMDCTFWWCLPVVELSSVCQAISCAKRALLKPENRVRQVSSFELRMMIKRPVLFNTR